MHQFQQYQHYFLLVLLIVILCLSGQILALKIHDVQLMSLNMSIDQTTLASADDGLMYSVTGHINSGPTTQLKLFRGWYAVDIAKEKSYSGTVSIDLESDQLGVVGTGELSNICNKAIFPLIVEVQTSNENKKNKNLSKITFELTLKSILDNLLATESMRSPFSFLTFVLPSTNGKSSLTVRVNPGCVEEEKQAAKKASLQQRYSHGKKELKLLCVEQDDDTNGHYICSSSGNKICRPGFMEPATGCLKKQEEVCHQYPTMCGSHGRCIDLKDKENDVFRFYCLCHSGYMGVRCTDKIPVNY